jgi:hypothetical protein
MPPAERLGGSRSFTPAIGPTERISASRGGGDSDDVSFPPSITHDGRFIAFGSLATNLTALDTNHTSNVFVRDRQAGLTLAVDVNVEGGAANGGTLDGAPSITGDGVQIGFVSSASNLVDTDNEVPDVFIVCNPFVATAPAVPPGRLQSRTRQPFGPADRMRQAHGAAAVSGRPRHQDSEPRH